MSLPDLYDKAVYNRIGQMPSNRIYKYLALVFAIAGIIIMSIAIIGIDSFSLKAILFLRGWAGICAVLFIIFVAIYLYRVYKTLFNQNPK